MIVTCKMNSARKKITVPYLNDLCFLTVNCDSCSAILLCIIDNLSGCMSFVDVIFLTLVMGFYLYLSFRAFILLSFHVCKS